MRARLRARSRLGSTFLGSLALTFGDCSGIGPEVAVVALTAFLRRNRDIAVEVFAPRLIFEKYASSFLLGHPRVLVTDDGARFDGRVGRPSLGSARRALWDLERAVESCLSFRNLGLVTGPVDKFWCSKVDSRFRGHTEYLQERTGVKGTTMLLASSSLRVALVTTHVAVKNISKSLTPEKIIATVERTHAFLKAGRRRPKLACAGLNPHASDGGLFGTEEARTIEPAIRKLQKRGISIDGPWPADTLFWRASRYDAIICMYHDQGLIPLKMNHFYDAVNITLGLPFLRTSVDHGTAFDIAGKGRAESQSYANALEYAYQFIKRRR